MSVLAFDLGASSGRALIGRLEGERIAVEEIHRFPNDPVQVGRHLYWDILRLYHEIKTGLVKAANAEGSELESVAIDSWAVDFGLLDGKGDLLRNPFHYRDHHTDGKMEEVIEKLSVARIFQATGIQFLPFNTLYQLHAIAGHSPELLERASSLLMIPDLLRYFLTGEQKGEFTNASTTQFLSATTGEWDQALLADLGLPHDILPPIAQPGDVVGQLQASVCEELRVPSLPVIAVGEHDTAAAVAAIPALERDFAYLSCGTWSLMGTEVGEPVLSEAAERHNFTNEGGVYGTYRLLKNIMGLWLIQECKRTWDKEGTELSFPVLVKLAEEAPAFRSLIDPDDASFLNPLHMPEAVQAFCRKTNQPVPETTGEIVRCILESLALKYRFVLERTEELSGKTFSGLHMVGGGIHNELLCRFTASAIGRPVWAGPAEGSGIGNIVVQMITLGKIKDIWEARRMIRESFPIHTWQPENVEDWEAAYQRLSAYLPA